MSLHSSYGDRPSFERCFHIIVERILGLWQLIRFGHRLKMTEYTVVSDKVPEGLDGFSILQLSDFHASQVFEKNPKLMKELRRLKPDVILLTGDMMQLDYKNEQNTVLKFYQMISEAAPTYAILGNHEMRSDYFPMILADLRESGVRLLRNEGTMIQKGDARLFLYGMETYNSSSTCRSNIRKKKNHQRITETDQKLTDAMRESEPFFRILMAHRPELFSLYQESEAELVFSGHAHGGLMKIGNRGLYAPGQGLLPRFTQGSYSKDNVQMIVNSGIGGPHLFVWPEIVRVVLKKEERTVTKEE